MESLYKLVEKLISYLYTILLNKLCNRSKPRVFNVICMYITLDCCVRALI